MKRFGNAPDASFAKELLTEIAERNIKVGPRKVDRPLALYGAGNLGRMAKEYFERIGIKVECVVDVNAEGYCKDLFWNGIVVLSPEEVDARNKNNDLLAICVANYPFDPLKEELLRQGWNNIVPFYDVAEAYRDQHPLGNGWFAKSLDSISIDRICHVLGTWADNISRAHHLQFIAWHLLREEWSFDDSPVNTENRYFIPEILNVLSDDESFADIGAHNGSVSTRFIEQTNAKFKRIWAVEPDSSNLQVLQKEMKKSAYGMADRIEVVPYVVGKAEGRGIFFSGLGYASQLTKLGETLVDIITIDMMKMSPSFIKLHLEGGELGALEGAIDTIKEYRPIIASTSYHNDDGLWRLPAWMMDNLHDYNIYMRLHSWCGTGAVVYAIPKERITMG